MFNIYYPEINQSFLFQTLGAFVVLLIGLAVAKIISKIISKFLDKIGLNQVIGRLGLNDALARVDIRLDMVRFFEEIAKWQVLFIFLMIAFDIVGFVQFSQLLEKVVNYFPNILIASLIFIVTVFLIDFTYRIFFFTAGKTKLIYSRLFSVGVRRAIWVLAVLAILYQLRIVPNLILSLFIAILGLIVLACGIAFGLGGKDIAKKILEEWKEKIS
jgi:hypothetical protein